MFKTINVGLTLHTGQFLGTLRTSAAGVREFGREVTQVSMRTDQAARQTLRTTGQMAALTGGALALGLAMSTKQAMAFERELRNVNSISKMSETQLASTGNTILGLSRTLPQSATTLARGLYDIASSGFQGAEGLHVLRTSAVAASAGLTDTATAARAITAVLNAYGLSAGHAGDISDILFQTVNLGVVTFEELAGTVGDFVGSAAAAGVPIDEASAALATMTLSGLNADEAGTSLNRTMQALIDPSEAMARLLRSLGYESGTAALNALGLRGTMDLLRESTGGNIESLVRLFPEIRAARGALALMAADGHTYTRVADEITDVNKRAGAAQAAFNEQAESTSFKLDIARNSVGAMGVEVGNVLLPAVATAANFVTGFVSAVDDLPGPVKTATVGTAALGAVVLTTGGAFLLFAPRLVAAKTLMNDLAISAPRTATAIGFLGRTVSYAVPILAVATIGLSIYGAEKAKVRQRTQELAEALTAEREGMEGATDAAITKSLVEKNLVTTAERLGLSIADVIGAIKGEEGARERLNVQMARYNDLVHEQTDTIARNESMTTDLQGNQVREKTYQDLVSIQDAVGGLGDAFSKAGDKDRQLTKAQEATGRATTKTGAATGEQAEKLRELERMLGGAEGAARGMTDAQRELLSAVQGFIDPAALLGEIESEKEQVRKRSNRTTESAVKRELDLESAVLGVARAERQLVVAGKELDRLRKENNIEEVAAAERSLEEAVVSSERAHRRLADARAELDRLRAGPDALSVEKAALNARQAEINATKARKEADAADAHVTQLREWAATEEELAPMLMAREEAMIRAREAEIAAAEAQARLNDVRDGSSPVELRNAELDLADAQRAVESAERDVTDRRRELDEVRTVDRTDEITDAELAYKEALLGVRQAHEAVAEAQRKGTEASDEFDGSVKKAQATLVEFEAKLREQIAAQQDWERNLVTIARRGGVEVAEEFRKLGRDHAGIVSQMAGTTDTEFNRMAELMRTKAELGSFEHYTALDKGLKVATEVARGGIHATAEAIAGEMNLSVAQVKLIADQYGIVLSEGIKPILKEVGPGQFRSYVPGKGFVGAVMEATGGVLNAPTPGERHVAQIAPPGAWRVWAEPETGGEAYIPLTSSPGQRRRSVRVLENVAEMFGYSLAEYRTGGFHSVADIPLPPRFEKFGRNLSTYGSGFTQVGYEAAADVVRAASLTTTPGAAGSLGSGWRTITGYLDSRNVDYRVTSTTGGRHAPGSYHYAGKAVDLVGNMRLIFDTLTAMRTSLAELFYTPAGYSIKNSAIVRPPIAAAGHYNHVHAATYDQGGPLHPGLTLAYNGTGRTEWVGKTGGGLVVNGPLCTITIHTDANVDHRAFEHAVRQAVEPALRTFATELELELQGD